MLPSPWLMVFGCFPSTSSAGARPRTPDELLIQGTWGPGPRVRVAELEMSKWVLAAATVGGPPAIRICNPQKLRSFLVEGLSAVPTLKQAEQYYGTSGDVPWRQPPNEAALRSLKASTCVFVSLMQLLNGYPQLNALLGKPDVAMACRALRMMHVASAYHPETAYGATKVLIAIIGKCAETLGLG